MSSFALAALLSTTIARPSLRRVPSGFNIQIRRISPIKGIRSFIIYSKLQFDY